MAFAHKMCGKKSIAFNLCRNLFVCICVTVVNCNVICKWNPSCRELRTVESDKRFLCLCGQEMELFGGGSNEHEACIAGAYLGEGVWYHSRRPRQTVEKIGARTSEKLAWERVEKMGWKRVAKTAWRGVGKTGWRGWRKQGGKGGVENGMEKGGENWKRERKQRTWGAENVVGKG